MTPFARTAIAAMTLSAAGIGGHAIDEGFRATAYIPVAGDRWTYGFGSTFKADGTPVKQGDTITPVQAVNLMLKHIAVDEAAVRKCVTAPVYQAEYDLLIGHAYQYGHAATCKSTIVKRINERKYAEACQQYARWTFVDGKDCRAAGSTCPGVATRADARVEQCLAAQNPEVARIEEVIVEASREKQSPWPLIIGVLFAGIAGYFVYRRWKK
jgi:lysozyme